jgi:hypothetical protein
MVTRNTERMGFMDGRYLEPELKPSYKGTVLVLVLFAGVVAWLFGSSAVSSLALQKIYDMQTYYPELDNDIKACLEDGKISNYEYWYLDHLREDVDCQDTIDKMKNRHPLRQLKEDIQKEIEETGKTS